MMLEFLVSRKPKPLQEVQTFRPVPLQTGQFMWVPIPMPMSIPMPMPVVGKTENPGTPMAV